MADLLDVDNLKKILNDFVVARDWAQFHDPKNLSMALAAEAGELLEIFQWMPNSDARQAKNKLEIVEKTREELADILLYLIHIADLLGINLSEAVLHKIKINNEKYPKEQVRGSAKKYTEYPKG